MIDLIADDDVEPPISRQLLTQAVDAAMQAAGVPVAEADLCIRFANDDEVRRLNAQWRDRDRVTDVISFPMQEPDAVDPRAFLGDIVLAMPFVVQEAERLSLPPADHAAHLVVHGVLHLLGFDHQDDGEAEAMQRLERQAMRQLQLHDPYPETSL